MQWLSSSLGKKYVMALTGFFLVFFALAHMMGNLTTFGGPAGLNAYAEHLRAFPPVLWAFRALMLGAVVLHLFFGLALYLQNKAARPVDYACKKNERTTFSALSMVWTGLLLLVFIVIHLAQFTFHGLLPAGAVIENTAAGHFNVFAMVATSLSSGGVAVFYLASVVVLLLHILHGAGSFLQSLGATNENTFECITKTGKFAAFVIALGFVLVPLSVLFGIVK
jgi:succinate dehydrogenase / fumarate reductase cytochrome b subunit